MTETQRLRRKDLKGPDEFQHATQRALKYLREHEREVTVAVIAFVVVALVVVGVRSYRGWRDAQASEAFRHAFQAYVTEDSARAATGFAGITERWPGSRWSHLAFVYQGELASRKGDRGAAIAAFSSLLEATDEPALRQIAEYNLGITKRASGDPAAAADHLRRAAKIEGPLQAAAMTAIAADASAASEVLGVGDIEGSLSPELREFIGNSIGNSVQRE